MRIIYIPSKCLSELSLKFTFSNPLATLLLWPLTKKCKIAYKIKNPTIPKIIECELVVDVGPLGVCGNPIMVLTFKIQNKNSNKEKNFLLSSKQPLSSHNGLRLMFPKFRRISLRFWRMYEKMHSQFILKAFSFFVFFCFLNYKKIELSRKWRIFFFFFNKI